MSAATDRRQERQGMSIERVTMMEWFDAPTPTGRTRSFRIVPFGPDRRPLWLGMVGEKQLSWGLTDE